MSDIVIVNYVPRYIVATIDSNIKKQYLHVKQGDSFLRS